MILFIQTAAVFLLENLERLAMLMLRLLTNRPGSVFEEAIIKVLLDLGNRYAPQI